MADRASEALCDDDVVTRLVEMRYNNDCSISAVATVLNLPYQTVFDVATRHLEFRPGGEHSGVRIQSLLTALGCGYRMSDELLLDRQPLVAVVPSVNIEGSFHAVVVARGTILDGNMNRKVSFSHVQRNCVRVFYDFKKHRRN